MKYIAIFDDSMLSNFRLDDEDRLTLVLTDKNNCTRAVRLKPYGICNQCGVICEVDNFCGNCGADMRGGNNGKKI